MSQLTSTQNYSNYSNFQLMNQQPQQQVQQQNFSKCFDNLEYKYINEYVFFLKTFN